jgi:hypothetical protein
MCKLLGTVFLDLRRFGLGKVPRNEERASRGSIPDQADLCGHLGAVETVPWRLRQSHTLARQFWEFGKDQEAAVCRICVNVTIRDKQR